MYENTTHIDYITFTFRPSSFGHERVDIPMSERYAHYMDMCYPKFRDFWQAVFNQPKRVGGANKGYTHHVQCDAGGVQICWGGNAGTVYVEMPASACKLFREVGRAQTSIWNENDLLITPSTRFKRIDIATDVATDDDPRDMDKFIHPPMVLSRITERTQDGRTEYYGSDESERQLVVYRYEKPHPRHPYLRWEFRLRGEKAKDAAIKIPRDGLHQVYARLLVDWAIDYKGLENLSGLEPTDKLAYQKKQKAGRTRWIYGTAIPALAKEIAQGNLTIDEVIKALEKESEDKKPIYKTKPRK